MMKRTLQIIAIGLGLICGPSGLTAGYGGNREIPIVDDGVNPADAPVSFNGVSLGEGFFFSDWYGIYNNVFFPWVFHLEHGWQFVFETGNPEAVFLFDLQSQDFWWTTSAFEPLTFYSFNRKSFNFYFVGTANPRQFVDLQSKEFWTIP